MSDEKPDPGDSFEQHAAEKRQGLIAEFFEFLKENKKWWLLPILIVILVFGALVLLTASGIAPFIYPLF